MTRISSLFRLASSLIVSGFFAWVVAFEIEAFTGWHKYVLAAGVFLTVLNWEMTAYIVDRKDK